AVVKIDRFGRRAGEFSRVGHDLPWPARTPARAATVGWSYMIAGSTSRPSQSSRSPVMVTARREDMPKDSKLLAGSRSSAGTCISRASHSRIHFWIASADTAFVGEELS